MLSAMSGLGAIFPIYVVIDESASMWEALRQVDEEVAGLVDAFYGNPLASELTRMSIIGFADEVTCYLELSDLRDVTYLPRLTAKGGTSYASIFRYLCGTIPEDIRQLYEAGLRVTRPVVLLLTDGVPNAEDWVVELQRLKSLNTAPELIVFGMQGSDPQFLAQIATRSEYVFLSREPGFKILRHFFDTVARSTVASTLSSVGSDPHLRLVLPESSEVEPLAPAEPRPLELPDDLVW
jgi:uncharacterized protein YegL